MIEFRLLGQIGLRGEDGTEYDSLLRQPKRLAVLAYLASPAPGTWHRRDTLLALFWPELDGAHARTSLRNSIYIIRQTLGDDVIRSRGDDELSVDPARVRTDVQEVCVALRESRVNDALAAYGGELLPGLFPQDSDGFQRWVDGERGKLQAAISGAAVSGLAHLERDGNYPEAIATGRRVLDIQPDDETLVRRVMMLHESAGDRAGALSIFEAFKSRLESDFDAQPSDETIALAQRLRAPSAHPDRIRNGQDRNGGQRAVPTVDDSHAISNDEAVATTDARRSAGMPAEMPAEMPAVPAEMPAAPGRQSAASVARITGIAAAILIVVAGVTSWMALRPARTPALGASTPVTSDEGLQIEAAISPNGRLVAYAKGGKTRLDIFVQKLAGGAAWRLTDDSSATEQLPKFSPDNDQVLYLANNNAYVTAAVGGTPRQVAAGTEGDGMIRSASWSVAGDSLLIVRADSLTVRPLQGNGSRYVGSARLLHSCEMSPRGRWIACVSGNWIAYTLGPLFGNASPSSVVLFPATGGAPIDLTGADKEYKNPAWSADGRFLWVLSDRDGVPNEVYSIRIGGDGHASGDIVRVGLNAQSISLSRNRIVYSVTAHKANVWSLPIPTDSAVSLAGAKPLTTGNQVIEVINVSPDGKWLVYDSDVHGNADIYRVPLDGGAAERLTDDPRPEYAADFSPDGKEFAWQRFISGRRHLIVKSLDSDVSRELLPDGGDQTVPRWSPSGDALLAWTHDTEEGGVFIIRRDAKGSWTKPFWMSKEGTVPIWSPDGASIAILMVSGRIDMMPSDSGARRTVYAPRRGSNDPKARLMRWGAKPGTVWFVGQQADGASGIWELQIPGGGRPVLRVRFDDASGQSLGVGFAVHGANFYFTRDERSANVRWGELGSR